MANWSKSIVVTCAIENNWWLFWHSRKKVEKHSQNVDTNP
jgi:hypothetical protein